jgi:hypothetical protein
MVKVETAKYAPENKKLQGCSTADQAANRAAIILKDLVGE